jgi:thioredoxin reductase
MNFETIIVGGGPAAIQLGYFLQKGGHKYVILEKAPIAGSFFDRYPLSGKLISINKKHTGSSDPEFNLRHDWNSLLSDDETMRFTNYSDEYYPDQKDLVRYLNDFATKFQLNIKYNSEVLEINKEEDGTYSLDVIHDGKKEIKEFTCTKLVIATGLSKEVKPNYVEDVKRKIMHYKDYPKDYFKKAENLELFKNKSVLIIGNGNSAFELGNLLTPYTSNIVITGRSKKAWAMSTHYTGDLRSIYLPFYDTFLLKSQNGLDEGINRLFIDQETPTSPYTTSKKCCATCDIKHKFTFGSKSEFDHIIYCTGWKFDDSLFQFEVTIVQNEKYPSINLNYESGNNKNLFFIGSLMHSHDFKESSGGFIHGFRYLIKLFYQMNYSNKYDVQTFRVKGNFKPLLDFIYERINRSSALYQMYGKMSDIFYHDMKNGEVVYYSNVHSNLLNTPIFREINHCFYRVTLEYGQTLVTNIKELGRNDVVVGKESHSYLLHPVLSIFLPDANGERTLVDRVHFSEDLLADFSANDMYYEKMGRALRMFM